MKPPHSLSKLAGEFREAVTDVTPLPARNSVLLPKPRPRPTVRSRFDKQLLADDLSDHLPHTFAADEPLSFQRPGLQRQAMRQLKRGGSIIEDELDLHGLTVAQARPLLVAFLNHARSSGLRFVRVIHGKGLRSSDRGGVLKGLVASWLMQRDDVMAFHEARPADGGSGAVLVLLRKSE
jgi:DNA-nicking Smr family endonuclease